MIQLKRIYDAPKKSDGYRVLVDRLWPRGISKEKAKVDIWLKDIAPSNELRKWFNHDPLKWAEFQKRYKKEIQTNKEIVAQLKDVLSKNKTVTLLFSASDTEHNNAVALAKMIESEAFA